MGCFDRETSGKCAHEDTSIFVTSAGTECKQGVVVYPTSNQDVSSAVKLATKHGIALTSVCGMWTIS